MPGPAPMLLTCFLAVAVLGQEPELMVAQLHDARLRIAALDRLGRLGADALPALMRDLELHIARNDQAGEARLLLAIGRLGARAAPATESLVARLATVPEASLVPLLRAIGSIGPAAVRARPDALEQVKLTQTPTGRPRQEWNLTVQRLTLVDPTREQLIAMLRRKMLVPVCVVALWIAEDPTRVDGLQEALLEAHKTALQQRKQHGDSYQPVVEETALALVRTASDPVQRDLAWECLLGYHDPLVRLEAAAALRRVPGAMTSAVPALVAALADPERAVVREAMITLGFFSDEAIAALPPLRRLQQGDDVELRQVAIASSRSIRRSLSPVPAAVAALLDATPAESPDAIRRVAALGPWAKAPLEALLSTASGELRERCSMAMVVLGR